MTLKNHLYFLKKPIKIIYCITTHVDRNSGTDSKIWRDKTGSWDSS